MCIELGLIRRVYPTDKQTNILILLIYIDKLNFPRDLKYANVTPIFKEMNIQIKQIIDPSVYRHQYPF